MTYRSTTLRLVERNCPRALQYYEERRACDLSATECGTAAHAVLHEAGKLADHHGRALTEDERHTVASETIVKLTTMGRDFDGEPEPPLSILPAQEGAALALDWLAEFGEQLGRYELPLGMTMEGRRADYDTAWYRGILDYVNVEESLERVLVIRDYKSYYSAGEAELRGVQLRGQAVLAHANGLADDCDVLRLEVANLRTRTVASSDLYLRHPSAEETLKRWRLHLVRLISALERQRTEGGGLPASPGPACHGCPYIGTCEAVGAYLDGQGLPKSRQERAKLFAVLEARLDSVKSAVKADCNRGPVSVGGDLLGFHEKPVRSVDHLVGQSLWDAWSEQGGEVTGLLYAMKPTVSNLGNVAHAVKPGDREAQDEWLEPLLGETKKRYEFGWRKITDEELTGGEQ